MQGGKKPAAPKNEPHKAGKMLSFIKLALQHVFFNILCGETRSRQKAFLLQTKAVVVLGTELVQVSCELNESFFFHGAPVLLRVSADRP